MLGKNSTSELVSFNASPTNHLEDTPQGMCVRAFPARFNGRRKTHFECEWHHPTGWGPTVSIKDLVR